VDEVHVKLYLQLAEAGYIPATSELNKDILPNQVASLQDPYPYPPDPHRVPTRVCKPMTTTKRGSFRPNFFPPINIPVIPHTPFIEKNILIPPGIYEEVCAVIHKKLAAGVYEPSNSSYRLRWFCVLKKVTNTVVSRGSSSYIRLDNDTNNV
jgi:hypothetical protein